ncbi:MAG: hypothetical protein ACRD3O_06955 [Terriglobia bacterium]
MNQTPKSVDQSVRKAFELLIQIRSHRHAGRLLDLANNYLRMLTHAGTAECVPIMVTVRTVRIREP